MSKGINKILGFMRLNDNEYDDDFDEFEEAEQETPVHRSSKKKSSISGRRAAASSSRPSSYDADDIDDISDDDEPDETFSERRTSSRFRRSGNIVQMNARSRAMEVRVSRPVDFESCQEISDIILENKAAIINFEAVTTEEAQRIIDFVSGSCYAIDGTVKQVSENIVVVTPNDIDITGDFQDGRDSEVEVPEFSDDDFDEGE